MNICIKSSYINHLQIRSSTHHFSQSDGLDVRGQMAAAQLQELQRQDRNGWDPAARTAQQPQAAWRPTTA